MTDARTVLERFREFTELTPGMMKAYPLLGEVFDELEAHDQLLDLRHAADMRAIKRWREAHPGNELVLPDHADLVVWLLEQMPKGEQIGVTIDIAKPPTE